MFLMAGKSGSLCALIVSVSVIFVVVIVVLCFMTVPVKVFCQGVSVQNSTYLTNTTIWKSPYYQYNPSVQNSCIVVRKHKATLFGDLLTALTRESQCSVLLYRGQQEKELTEAGNLEDARLYFHDNKYYLLAVKLCITVGATRGFCPRLLVYNDDFTFNTELHLPLQNHFPVPISQKNWTLFANEDGKLLIFTDVYPRFIIRRLDLSIVVNTDMTGFFDTNMTQGHIRCSTNFVPWPCGAMVCALHVLYTPGRRYRTLFFKVHGTFPYNPIAFSPLYHFEQTLVHIEFASGLDWSTDKTKLHVAYGINDYKGKVVSVEPKAITWKVRERS